MSTITSVTFTPAAPAAGETVTLTVSGTWMQSDLIIVATGDGAQANGTLNVTQPVVVSDPAGRTWTPVSNTGTQATFTATA